MRKYSLNESYFDSIDTEQKAYFLGFLYADGYNNTSRGVVNLSLKEDDSELLQVLNSFIQPDKPLQYINLKNQVNSGKSYSNSKNQVRLAISSRKISNALIKLGCTNRKTFTLTFPQIQDELLPHFIRGIFDGDGSVCLYESQGYVKSNFTLTSTKEFINSFQEILVSNLGFNKVKTLVRHPERNNNIETVNYSGRLRCKAFANWIYKDATVFLKRKKEIFDKL